jgi:hypothetical protein
LASFILQTLGNLGKTKYHTNKLWQSFATMMKLQPFQLLLSFLSISSVLAQIGPYDFMPFNLIGGITGYVYVLNRYSKHD